MKKTVSLILSAYLALYPFAAAAEEITATTAETAVQAVSPLENVYSVDYTLSDGLTYTRNISYADSYGSEREYILNYTPGSTTRIAFANGGYLYQTSTIRNLAAAEYPEENYIAGINADFFNMSTGVPESAYIKDNELYTTDRDSFCLAEREDGSFFIDKPQIKLTLTDLNSATDYNILHLNKEFSEYGLYLYNARYSPTTHISAANTSVVLYAYSDKKTESELIRDLTSAEELPGEAPDDVSEETMEETTERTMEETAEEETKEASENESDLSDKQNTEPTRAVLAALNDVLSRREALEPYSEDYTALTQEIEELLTENTGYQKIGSEYFLTTSVFPQIGKNENLVVATVNPTAGNESIPENAYLLSADNSSYGYILMAFVPGQTFSLSVNGNEAFENVKNAVGTGTVIVNHSEPVDDRTFSHYLSAQPRSAVGIRADGSLVLYAVDGRQSAFSAGLKLYDLAKRMASLGCVTAANLDGGGSTVINASLRGSDAASTVSSPSGKTERRVSNGIVFTNTAEKTGIPSEAYYYGDYYLTLSDMPISLGEVVLSDSNGFASSDDTSAVSPVLFTKNASTVSDGVLSPNGETGVIEVFATVDDGATENTAAKVVSLKAPDEIHLSADKAEIAPFETVSLSASAFYRKLNVASDFHSYVWQLSEENTPTESTASLGTISDGVFTPAVDGKTITVTASRGDTSASVKIAVAAYPFADMKEHWACKEIYHLYQTGVVKGELDADGTAFYLPERQFSRYEFCVMLERLTGIGRELPVPEMPSAAVSVDTDAEAVQEPLPEGETPTQTQSLEEIFGLADAAEIPDWAFSAVYRLKETGLLDGILHHDLSWNDVFEGNQPITRAEVIQVVGKICDAAPLDFSLEAFADLDEWQKRDDFIKNAVNAGVFSGYEDNTLRLERQLTRAEGAAVFVRLKDHLEASESSN